MAGPLAAFADASLLHAPQFNAETPYCPHFEGGTFVTLSLHEILKSSDEARYWALGFVAGSEPGSPLDGAGYELPEDSLEFVAWDVTRADYLVTGYWPQGAPRRP